MAGDGYLTVTTAAVPPAESTHSQVLPTAPLERSTPGAGRALPTAMPRAAAASLAEINAQALLSAATAPLGADACPGAADGESGGTADVACPDLALAVVPPHAATLSIVAADKSHRCQTVPLLRLVIADCLLSCSRSRSTGSPHADWPVNRAHYTHRRFRAIEAIGITRSGLRPSPRSAQPPAHRPAGWRAPDGYVPYKLTVPARFSVRTWSCEEVLTQAPWHLDAAGAGTGRRSLGHALARRFHSAGARRRRFSIPSASSCPAATESVRSNASSSVKSRRYPLIRRKTTVASSASRLLPSTRA